jgi:hypothetical protein
MNTPDFDQREQEKQCYNSKNAESRTTMLTRYNAPHCANSGKKRNAEPKTYILTVRIDGK